MGNRIDDLEKSIGDLMQQVRIYIFLLPNLIVCNKSTTFYFMSK